jgi:hypothetical protein
MAKSTKMAITCAIATVAALGLALSSSLITPPAALAAGPHYIGTPTCTTSTGIDAGGSPIKTLTCTGRIGGLANIGTERAFIHATYLTCSLPSFPSFPFTITGRGTADFTASLTVVAAPPPCPPVVFSNVAISVLGAGLPIPGTFG